VAEFAAGFAAAAVVVVDDDDDDDRTLAGNEATGANTTKAIEQHRNDELKKSNNKRHLPTRGDAGLGDLACDDSGVTTGAAFDGVVATFVVVVDEDGGEGAID
jgi:hypothetical protein